MEIVSPYTVVEVKSEEKLRGYIRRVEVVDCSDMGSEDMEMVNCYSEDTGHWIGDENFAKMICDKFGLRQVQKAAEKHCVASIGFNEEKQMWFGWSHRAICGFGEGDYIFDERYGNDETPYRQHGKEEILDMDDAKKAAINFAAYVS